MSIYIRMEKLTQRIAEECRQIDRKSIEDFINAIISAERIFVNGAGRSGLVAKAFAMRLMHLGFIVYVVGETITPAITHKDLLITLSGSGRTSSIVGVAKIAKAKGAKIAAITSFPESELGSISDCIVQIKGRKLFDEKRDYEVRQVTGEHEPITPLGTLFELTAMVFLDTVIEEIMRRKNKSEEHMKLFHTNLE
ncbi:MAG: 6-phospho-3-hexuloisomerase [Candidatus Micrarchaeia archaeon]